MELVILAIYIYILIEYREGSGHNTKLLLYTLNAYVIYPLIPNLSYYICIIIPKMKMCMLFSTFEKVVFCFCFFFVTPFLSKSCPWKKFPALEFDPFL